MDLNQGMFYFNAGKNMSKKSNFKLSSYFIVAKKVDNGFYNCKQQDFTYYFFIFTNSNLIFSPHVCIDIKNTLNILDPWS